MTESFDVIVIGGGPAGSTTASFLAGMGHRVLLLEREVFPRHHVGESMIAATIDILAEIGLEEKLASAGFPVKSGGCFLWGRSADPWCIRFEEIPGRPTSYQVKRSVFDKLLLDHAAERGVDVRQGQRVIDVLVEEGRVNGVRYQDANGTERVATGRFTVDASGLAAVVAKRLSRRVPVEELKNMCLYGYWRGEHPAPAALGGEIRPQERNNIIIKMLSDGWLWFIPLGRPGANGTEPRTPEISVGFVAPRKNLPESGGGVALERFYLERIAATTEWQYLLQHATYTNRFHTVKDWSYRSEEMAGPGFFAVGDASCFVDPILSSGVFLAVLYAKMCAIGVNTLLTTSAPDSLVNGWYQQLYLDTYSDYVEMARHWYHGHREVGMWMDRARQQLREEADPVFAATNREAFVALATGNIHAHPNYVLLRQLESFPLSLYLRKDPRALYFREMKTVLLGHAPRSGVASPRELETSSTILALPLNQRKELYNRIRNDQRQLVVQLAEPQYSPPSDRRLRVSSRARFSLEAVDNVVRFIVRAPGGTSRELDWERSQPLIVSFAASASPVEAARQTNQSDDNVLTFCAEMIAAGVLMAAES